jgi:hypothetical protein
MQLPFLEGSYGTVAMLTSMALMFGLFILLSFLMVVRLLVRLDCLERKTENILLRILSLNYIANVV